MNLDDCWQISRDPVSNVIQPDPTAFPSGMKALADYIHGKGLKFGLYSDAGQYTCQQRPGSLNYEDIDAQTYASWGVDFLKYDNCFNEGLDPKVRYPLMRDALNKTGRPIYYSLCEWGLEAPWDWAPSVGNSWRTTGDSGGNWDSVMDILDQQVNISSKGAPGGWNDPDILQVGLGKMSTTEDQSHFALWAFLKAPLIIGCDIRNMSNDTLRILTNSDIIGINQDPLGAPAVKLWNDSNTEIWGGPLQRGFGAILLNRGNATANITLNYSIFGHYNTFFIRDLIAQQPVGTFAHSFTAEVESHGVAAITLVQQCEDCDEDSLIFDYY